MLISPLDSANAAEGWASNIIPAPLSADLKDNRIFLSRALNCKPQNRQHFNWEINQTYSRWGQAIEFGTDKSSPNPKSQIQKVKVQFAFVRRWVFIRIIKKQTSPHQNISSIIFGRSSWMFSSLLLSFPSWKSTLLTSSCFGSWSWSGRWTYTNINAAVKAA